MSIFTNWLAETLSEAEVRRDLKKEEDIEGRKDDNDDDDDEDAPKTLSPAAFVIMGMDIEDAQ